MCGDCDGSDWRGRQIGDELRDLLEAAARYRRGSSYMIFGREGDRAASETRLRIPRTAPRASARVPGKPTTGASRPEVGDPFGDLSVCAPTETTLCAPFMESNRQRPDEHAPQRRREKLFLGQPRTDHRNPGSPSGLSSR